MSSTPKWYFTHGVILMVLLSVTLLSVTTVDAQSTPKGNTTGTTTARPTSTGSGLYAGCLDQSPSPVFCIGSKDFRMSYKKLKGKGDCVEKQNCDILVKVTKGTNGTDTFNHIIALKERPGNPRQVAKVMFSSEKYNKDYIKKNCYDGTMVRDAVYMEVDTAKTPPNRAVCRVTGIESLTTVHHKPTGKPSQQSYVPIKADKKSGYLTYEFITKKTVVFQETFSPHRKTFQVDFTAPISCTAFHLVAKSNGTLKVENIIYGLTPIRIFLESLVDKDPNAPDGNLDGPNLTWLWVILGILLILLIIFIIWLVCRRQAKDRKRYIKSEGGVHSPSKVPSGTTSGAGAKSMAKEPSKVASSGAKVPYSSPAGPITGSTASSGTASLRTVMTNSTAVSAQGNAAAAGSQTSKRSALASKTSASSGSSNSSSKKY